MKVDKKTLEDLAIWDRQGGVLSLLDNCITTGGSLYLRHMLSQPAETPLQLKNIQSAVRYSMGLADQWPRELNNGMIVMVEKFFSATESVISKPNSLNLFIDSAVRKLIPNNEQSLMKFSITQVINFVKFCNELHRIFWQEAIPDLLKSWFEEMQAILSGEHFQAMNRMPENPSYKALLTAAYYTRKHLKASCMQLVQIIFRLDYIRSLSIATTNNGWVMPEITDKSLYLKAEHLYHPLLAEPVAYDVGFSKDNFFLFITGANMSGKSTYMKSIGIAAYLAHIGCGVPAEKMAISFLNALITNMQIEDNIYTGESYFLAEVLRMKNTALQISGSSNNLVLMDELFKGTNIHDAYDCTQTVVSALLDNQNNLYCLSTHLYELGDRFRNNTAVNMKYFETQTSPDGSYHFTYRLQNGVSNDKIGFLVLKKEGVLDILKTGR